jgi:hypothetical protein
MQQNIARIIYVNSHKKKAERYARLFCDPKGIRTPTASVKGW